MMNESPPQFPSFPLPPPSSDALLRGIASEVAQQMLPPTTSSIGGGDEKPLDAMTMRERIAEEAIRSSIEHVVHEYVRQDLAERLGGGDSNADTVNNTPGSYECHVGSPQHTLRVGLLLLACAFGSATLLNTFSVTVLIAGCALLYISDSLGYQKGSIIVLIISLAAFGTAIVLSNLHALSSFGPLLFISNVILGLLFVTAAALIVHYRWLQTEFPLLVHFLERVSVSLGPVAALPPLLAICIAFLTARHAAFGFALAMCVLHYFYYSRLKSSFLFEHTMRKKRRENAEDAEDQRDEEETLTPVVLTGRDEAIVFTLATLVLPLIVYIVLQSNWGQSITVFHLVNMVGIVGIPVMYLFWDPRHSLWFLRPKKTPTAPAAATSSSTTSEDLQHDPLGIWDMVDRTRSSVLVVGYVIVLHWMVYRLLHSRYQYLFTGVPAPLNAILLMLAAYCFTGIVVLSAKILREEKNQASPTNASPATARELLERRRYAFDRIMVMLLSVAMALLIAGAAGMPQFFYPMSALTASSFNAYLLDRRNSSNFTLFCCCSSLLLMWWMYRTFSFIVMDLHVMGESTTVPTPVVAVSVLWCYLLGCISFGLSFSENKRPLHFVMFIHALKVAWVEHVLYSQRESGSYPGILVLVTSGVGVYVCLKLYRNGVMDIQAASFVSAAYLAKIFTFLGEVTDSYYIDEVADANSPSANVRRAVEIAAVWWAVMGLVYTAITMELERRERKANANSEEQEQEVTKRGITIVVCGAIVAVCTLNVQRSAAEFLLQGYLSREESWHAAVGSSLMTYYLATGPVLLRHLSLNPRLNVFVRISNFCGLVGLALFVVRPTHLVLPIDNVESDVEIVHHETGRLIALVGVGMAIGARFLKLSSLHGAIRGGYWFVASSLMAIGLTVVLVPAATKALALATACFVFFSILTVDVCHYRNLSNSEAWIVYALSVASMVLSFVALGRVDLQKHAGPSNLLLVWEMHETGRMTLLAVAAVTNIFLAVLLKFRLSGKSLLPNPVQLTNEMVQQIGIIGNYTALLSVVIMTILNLWAGNADPMIFIASSAILLLLVDDEMLFFELHRDANRYIPVLVYTVGALWGTLVFDAYQLYQEKGRQQLSAPIKSVLYALPVLPSHISLISVLWFGRNKGGLRVAAVIAFVVLDLLCLVLASRPIVQWMALIGIAGQACRLYEAKFWKRRHDALL